MEKGAFIGLSDNKDSIDLFIFINLSNEELRKALPILPPQEIKDHNMLCCIFNNGVDYLGSGTEDDVKSIIFKPGLEMIDLLNNNYESIKKKGLPLLEKKVYESLLDFSKKQLKIE